MKKIGMIFGILMMSTFFFSCGESAEDAKMNETLNQEADSLEMLDEDIDNTKEDLEKSTQEVDELLKDL